MSFSMMISLTIFLGLLLIASSWVFRSRYIAYNRLRQMYDLLTEISQMFEKQKRTVDAYMIGTESERHQFNAREIELNKLLDQWHDLAVYPLEKEEHVKAKGRLMTWRSSLDQVFRLVENNRRTEAIQIMEATVLSFEEQIQKELKGLAIQKRIHSDQAWESARRLASRMTVFSISLLISVILAGTGFSILLYQSITSSLEKLREGTRKIAQGEWDLRLELREPVELAELARSFEEMAKSLKSLQTQVVQMDRMSAVGTLAGGVAHEINNPLTGVLGQAQLLLEKLPPGDPNRSNVEKIERAAQRCRKIVRGLLDFSRPKSFNFEPTDVDHVIDAALSLCETEIAALHIEVAWQKNRSLPKIHASSHHLQQVFLNILTNAIHAMPKGGRLAIATQAQNDLVQISFSDTGAGIPPENIPKLFDAFFTTKEPGKGTGLGLTISYGIVQQHHGQIFAQSAGHGKGTTIVIRIPIAPITPIEAANSNA